MELVILFLEAVAKVTPAFQELHDTVLPIWDHKRAGVDEWMSWLKKWRLDFPENYTLSDLFEGWTRQVLDWWRKTPPDRNNLRVDINYFVLHPHLQTCSREPNILISMEAWNPYKENATSYTERMSRQFEALLADQVCKGREHLRMFDAEPQERRDRRPFEYLALHWCGDGGEPWTDEAIAAKYEQKRETVKGARKRLAHAIGFLKDEL